MAQTTGDVTRPPGDSDFEPSEPYYQNMQDTNHPDSPPLSTPTCDQAAALLSPQVVNDGPPKNFQTTVTITRTHPLVRPEAQPGSTDDFETASLTQRNTQDAADSSQFPPASQIADQLSLLPERMVSDTVDQGVVLHRSPPYIRTALTIEDPTLQPASRPGDHFTSGMGARPKTIPTYYSEYSDCDSEMSSKFHTIPLEQPQAFYPQREIQEPTPPTFMRLSRTLKPRPTELPIRSQNWLMGSDKENIDTFKFHTEQASEPPQHRPVTEKDPSSAQDQRIFPSCVTDHRPIMADRKQPKLERAENIPLTPRMEERELHVQFKKKPPEEQDIKVSKADTHSSIAPLSDQAIRLFSQEIKSMFAQQQYEANRSILEALEARDAATRNSQRRNLDMQSPILNQIPIQIPGYTCSEQQSYCGANDYANCPPPGDQPDIRPMDLLGGLPNPQRGLPYHAESTIDEDHPPLHPYNSAQPTGTLLDNVSEQSRKTETAIARLIDADPTNDDLIKRLINKVDTNAAQLSSFLGKERLLTDMPEWTLPLPMRRFALDIIERADNTVMDTYQKVHKAKTAKKTQDEILRRQPRPEAIKWDGEVSSYGHFAAQLENIRRLYPHAREQYNQGLALIGDATKMKEAAIFSNSNNPIQEMLDYFSAVIGDPISEIPKQERRIQALPIKPTSETDLVANAKTILQVITNIKNLSSIKITQQLAVSALWRLHEDTVKKNLPALEHTSQFREPGFYEETILALARETLIVEGRMLASCPTQLIEAPKVTSKPKSTPGTGTRAMRTESTPQQEVGTMEQQGGMTSFAPPPPPYQQGSQQATNFNQYNQQRPGYLCKYCYSRGKTAHHREFRCPDIGVNTQDQELISCSVCPRCLSFYVGGYRDHQCAVPSRDGRVMNQVDLSCSSCHRHKRRLCRCQPQQAPWQQQQSQNGYQNWPSQPPRPQYNQPPPVPNPQARNQPAPAQSGGAAADGGTVNAGSRITDITHHPPTTTGLRTSTAPTDHVSYPIGCGPSITSSCQIIQKDSHKEDVLRATTVFYDGGSQDNYVDQDLLQPEDYTQDVLLRINTLTGGTLKTCKVASIRLATTQGEEVITAIAIPGLRKHTTSQIKRLILSAPREWCDKHKLDEVLPMLGTNQDPDTQETEIFFKNGDQEISIILGTIAFKLHPVHLDQYSDRYGSLQLLRPPLAEGELILMGNRLACVEHLVEKIRKANPPLISDIRPYEYCLNTGCLRSATSTDTLDTTQPNKLSRLATKAHNPVSKVRIHERAVHLPLPHTAADRRWLRDNSHMPTPVHILNPDCQQCATCTSCVVALRPATLMQERLIKYFQDQITTEPVGPGDKVQFVVSLVLDQDKLARLPQNMAYARQRAEATEKGLLKHHPKALKKISEGIQELNGKAWEAVPPGDEKEDCHYIPLSYVAKSEMTSTTTTARILHDPKSAPTQGTLSLNEVQVEPPDIENPLLQVLFQSRGQLYLCSADVRKMFFQIKLHPSQRHLARFFTRGTVINGETILGLGDQTQPWVAVEFTSIAMGYRQSPCLAIMCRNKVADFIREKDEEAANQLDKNSYFDDIQIGLGSHEITPDMGQDDIRKKLLGRAKVVEEGLRTHNMPTKPWVSPTEDFNRLLQIELGTPLPPKADPQEEAEPPKPESEAATHTLLGYGWDIQNDRLTL